MPPKFVPPSIKLKAFNCPHCNALADQTWCEVYGAAVKDKVFFPDEELLARVKNLPPGEGQVREKHQKFMAVVEKAIKGKIFFGERSDPYVDQLWNVFVSVCRSCGEPALWHHDRVLYPHAQYEVEPNEDLSDDIKADFNEARTILDLSPRGTAALLRLCIQKLCKHLGQSGKNINDDIAALVKNGLDPKIQKALDIVRVVGNECVHPGAMDMKDDRKTAARLFTLVNCIAFDMITHPKELDALYNALPADKIAGINKLDAKPTVASP